MALASLHGERCLAVRPPHSLISVCWTSRGLPAHRWHAWQSVGCPRVVRRYLHLHNCGPSLVHLCVAGGRPVACARVECCGVAGMQRPAPATGQTAAGLASPSVAAVKVKSGKAGATWPQKRSQNSACGAGRWGGRRRAASCAQAWPVARRCGLSHSRARDLALLAVRGVGVLDLQVVCEEALVPAGPGALHLSGVDAG